MSAVSASASDVVVLEQAAVSRRGTRLFEQLDLTVQAGEVLAVMGPSGAGKSTLLSCLSGTVQLNKGSRRYGTTARPSPPARVFQDLRLVYQSSLLGNVLMARLGRYPWWKTLWSFPSDDQESAMSLLDRLGIGSLAARLAGEVSGGEQQRTAVARALFSESPLLLADEPVANLDEAHAERVLKMLRSHAREHGTAVVCVLHHPEQAQGFADGLLKIGQEWPLGWNYESLSEA